MTSPNDDLLTTTEGVDEGSAAATAEGPGTGAAQTVGGAPSSPADGESAPAPPVDMESEQSRDARAAAGSGQQLQAGEG